MTNCLKFRTYRYTGVSWVVNGGQRVVQPINQWPNPLGSERNRESQKIPTLISYHGREQKWGFKADSDKTTRCFKMALDHPSTYEKLVEEMGDYMDEGLRVSGEDLGLRAGSRQIEFDAKQLTVDYLRNVWSFTEGHLRDNVGPDWKRFYSLRVVIGVPAMWNPETRGRFQDILKEAGLPDDFHIISEPEAAALAVFQDRIDLGTMFKVSGYTCWLLVPLAWPISERF